MGFSANDGTLAEHLLDYIFLVSKRVRKNNLLLVVAADVHPEMREKVRLAAEVAFETVDVINAPAFVGPDKNVHVNRMVKTAAEHVAKTYRVPWLWIEPDCVPLAPDWLEQITAAHYAQPKRYSGSYLMSGGNLFLARVAVYPPDAINDLSGALAANAPFNMASGAVVIPKSTKTYLVQETAYLDEGVTLRENAVMLHHDKGGILMNKNREAFEELAAAPASRGPGRPKKTLQPA